MQILKSILAFVSFIAAIILMQSFFLLSWFWVMISLSVLFLLSLPLLPFVIIEYFNDDVDVEIKKYEIRSRPYDKS